MISRCTQESSPNFKYYGGRGIVVCSRWREFPKFKEDMFESYLRHSLIHGEGNTTIDRIDVDGDYTPNNTQWATYKKQSSNTRLRSSNTSGHTGVSRYRNTDRWRSRITIDGKEVSLGVYENKEDAIKARKEAELKYWGTE